ncbi:hypothetical protein [Priestia megaterium]|uniref:hypothetical protein n=1 Tax=Priestia megaterium TaxID=1404 RepID=UPI00319DEC1C
MNIAFIYSFSYFKQLIGGQGEDSCGNSGTGETPQERKRRGGSPAARGNQWRRHERFSSCILFVCI